MAAVGMQAPERVMTETAFDETANVADTPNPGSPKARDAGCRCPRMDNANGAGIGCLGDRFGWVMVADCPLHGFDAEDGE